MLKPEEYFEPLPKEDKDTEFIAVEMKSFARDVWERFAANRLALIGLIQGVASLNEDDLREDLRLATGGEEAAA
ncbi:MAG: hypothetical protein IJ074_08220 [Clostridia bacterium]|nr:hypothetical protein [Clostridia bacterium]